MCIILFCNIAGKNINSFIFDVAQILKKTISSTHSTKDLGRKTWQYIYLLTGKAPNLAGMAMPKPNYIAGLSIAVSLLSLGFCRRETGFVITCQLIQRKSVLYMERASFVHGNPIYMEEIYEQYNCTYFNKSYINCP